MSQKEDLDATATDTGPGGKALNEDWLATIVGLAILALALLGFIPREVLW
ncbi:hypothetical protein [Pseudothauera nasutitermitis]|nr:hypothetical protein [Pseudothauera nasutitermitis]